MSSIPSGGPVVQQGAWQIYLSVIYRGHEFEPQPGHIAFVESDHEIISIFSLPLIQRRAVVCYWRKHMFVLSVQVTAKEYACLGKV